MKANNNALVILWKGKELPDYLAQKVAEILITNGICIPEMLTMKYMDEESVAKALVRDNANRINVFDEDRKDIIAETVKQSVIYIGKRFEASLTGTNGNLAQFAIELKNAIMDTRNSTVFNAVGTEPQLLKAVEIIATTTAIIPAALAKKYHFSQNVVEVIKMVYKS